MSIGRILTLGFGPNAGANVVVTLGLAPGAAIVTATAHHGADDELDHYGLNRAKRKARILAQNKFILRTIVTAVTKGMLK